MQRLEIAVKVKSGFETSYPTLCEKHLLNEFKKQTNKVHLTILPNPAGECTLCVRFHGGNNAKRTIRK